MVATAPMGGGRWNMPVRLLSVERVRARQRPRRDKERNTWDALKSFRLGGQRQRPVRCHLPGWRSHSRRTPPRALEGHRLLTKPAFTGRVNWFSTVFRLWNASWCLNRDSRIASRHSLETLPTSDRAWRPGTCPTLGPTSSGGRRLALAERR